MSFSIFRPLFEGRQAHSFQAGKRHPTAIKANTELLFGLTLVQSELKVENRRFDSFDEEETNSFIIIEYKKGELFSH